MHFSHNLNILIPWMFPDLCIYGFYTISFTEMINNDCAAFQEEWNHHPLTGKKTHGKSPLVSNILKYFSVLPTLQPSRICVSWEKWSVADLGWMVLMMCTQTHWDIWRPWTLIKAHRCWPSAWWTIQFRGLWWRQRQLWQRDCCLRQCILWVQWWVQWTSDPNNSRPTS